MWNQVEKETCKACEYSTFTSCSMRYDSSMNMYNNNTLLFLLLLLLSMYIYIYMVGVERDERQLSDRICQSSEAIFQILPFQQLNL